MMQCTVAGKMQSLCNLAVEMERSNPEHLGPYMFHFDYV
jgi:hypothetical protein